MLPGENKQLVYNKCRMHHHQKLSQWLYADLTGLILSLRTEPGLIYMLLSFIIPFISTVTGNKAAERGKAHKGDGMC